MALTQAHYDRIAPPLPVPRGPVRLSPRPVLTALLSVAAPGGKGRGLPPRFGTWPPLYTRMNRWSKNGVLDRVFERLQREQIVRLKLEARSLDRPLVQVPPAGTGARTQPAPLPRPLPGRRGRARAGARGEEPGGPPRRSRGAPWASAREPSTRRTAIERVFRRLQGCRRLCSRCEQLDVLFPGCIGFALIINALR